jgi:hypothetical protein
MHELPNCHQLSPEIIHREPSVRTGDYRRQPLHRLIITFYRVSWKQSRKCLRVRQVK